MSSSLPDDINALKRLLAEQEALNRALQEKLNEREREIDHLQAQLDTSSKSPPAIPVSIIILNFRISLPPFRAAS
ncbi:hypothetical protein KXR05_001615 [Escherichia coli]|nr:hypothetical protein [Escherichia coli]